MIRAVRDLFQRKNARNRDMDSIQNTIYNEPTGSQKNINIEPVIRDVYVANTSIDFGSYVKVAAGSISYDMVCNGREHSPTNAYRKGDIVTSGGQVYVAVVNIKAGKAFDGTDTDGDWTRVAPQTISGIPVTGGATVCVGKYHNSISVGGFIVDDSSTFSRVE